MIKTFFKRIFTAFIIRILISVKFLFKRIFFSFVVPYKSIVYKPSLKSHSKIFNKIETDKITDGFFQNDLEKTLFICNVYFLGKTGLSFDINRIILNGYYPHSSKEYVPKKLVSNVDVNLHANYLNKKIFIKNLDLISNKSLIITGIGSSGYYHWFIEILPKLIILNYVENIEVIVMNGLIYQFQKESLEIFDIKDKIIFLEPTSSFKISNAIIPNFTSLSSWKIKWLQQIFDQYRIEAERIDFIYISRSKARSRRIINEDKLWNYLKNLNFQKIYLEDISFQEQVELFYNAKVIIGPHGAGLTNIIYCKTNTKIIEIMPSSRVKKNFEIISNYLSLQYSSIPFKSVNDKHDMLVEIESIEKALIGLI